MVQDSRSASYPGAAIASSYDFGSIDFFSLTMDNTTRGADSGQGGALTQGPLALRSGGSGQAHYRMGGCSGWNRALLRATIETRADAAESDAAT